MLEPIRSLILSIVKKNLPLNINKLVLVSIQIGIKAIFLIFVKQIAINYPRTYEFINDLQFLNIFTSKTD